MRIKTYIADNMQEAFYKVKSEMGKDAVILQTKHIKKGGFLGLFAKPMVEVVAAKDVKVASPKNKSSKSNILTPPKIPLLDTNIKSETEEIKKLKTDISEVKSMLKAIYNKQGAKEEHIFPPSLMKLYNRFIQMDVDSKIAQSIIGSVADTITDMDNADENKIIISLKNYIAKELVKIKPIQFKEGNKSIVAFVGPTGVGKTTTIAKLAANYSLYHDKKVAMIAADTFRVGAVEQLKLYGDFLEVPVAVVHSPQEIDDILDGFSEYDIIFVDTMGSSPNNKMQIRKIKGFLENLNPTDTHMVISAATKNEDLKSILQNYSELDYKKIVITKLDETKTYGSILNVMHMSDCYLSYITSGQNVPDDIEIASIDKIVDMILGAKNYV